MAAAKTAAGSTLSGRTRPLKGGGWFSLGAPAALHRSEPAGDEDPDRGEQGQPVAEGEADLEAVLGLADDPVERDQHEGGEADDRGHLAAGPGQRVAADHDPSQNEG